jgi:hypothetical protein
MLLLIPSSPARQLAVAVRLDERWEKEVNSLPR